MFLPWKEAPNFAWRRFSEVNGITIIFSREVDAKTGEGIFEKV